MSCWIALCIGILIGSGIGVLVGGLCHVSAVSDAWSASYILGTQRTPPPPGDIP